MTDAVSGNVVDHPPAQIMTGGIVGVARPMPAAAMARRQQNVLAMRMLALSTNEFPLIAPARLAALAMPVLLMRGDVTEFRAAVQY